MDETSPSVDVDKIQLKLFSKCRFQIIAFVCLGIIYARGAWNVFGVLFLAAEVGHSCDSSRQLTRVGLQSLVEHIYNHSSNSTIGSASWENGTEKELLFAECDVLVSYGNGTNISRPCTFGWVYRTEFESTIVSEWDLVCVRAYMSGLSTTLFMVGSMIGALLITPMADKFGRRLVLLVCLLAQAVLGAGVSLSPNYIVFTALRFVVGFFNMGIALSAYVMMTETFPAQHRTIPCCGFQIFWAFGIMLTALFGFMVRNWRHLQLIFSMPNLLCAVAVWFLPESLPWLISQKKISEAQSVIKRIGEFNGIALPSNLILFETLPSNRDNGEDNSNSSDTSHKYGEQPLLSDTSLQEAVFLSPESSSPQEFQKMSAGNGTCHIGLDQNGLYSSDRHTLASQLQESATAAVDTEVQITVNKSASYTKTTVPADGVHSFHNVNSVFELCHGSRICLYSVIMFYLFFVNSLSYFGISLSTPVLHGNQFFNLFLLGAVEIPAYVTCVLVCNRFGCKVPLCIFLLMCGVMNITAVLISPDASASMSGLRIACVMVGKFAITGGYTTVYLYSAEIFPTSVRSHAIGISSFFENLGSIAAPFIVFSAKSISELPMILFGLVSVIGGAMVTIMPETHNRPLPQTIEEVESWHMCRRRHE